MNDFKYLDEILVFVIIKSEKEKYDGNTFYAFNNYVHHVDALNYLYNNKINKTKKRFKIVKWHKIFLIKNNRKIITDRDTTIYKSIISNENNVLFLNTSKGGETKRGTLYIPKELSKKQYESLKYYENSLKEYELFVIYDGYKEKIVENNFILDDYYDINSNKEKIKCK